MTISPNVVYFLKASTCEYPPTPTAYRLLARRALSLFDLKLPAEGTVLLKPNATVLYEADSRIITHPEFLAGLLDVLIDTGISPDRLRVGDSQSGEFPDKGLTWESCGYLPMLTNFGVELVALAESEHIKVPVPDGVVYDAFPFAREVAECAHLINVPVAKCHNLGCITLATKNLMGVLLKPVRHFCRIQEVDNVLSEVDLWRLIESGISRFEDRFCQKLADLLSAVRNLGISRLNVIDGLVGRDGTAFNFGNNHPLGWTLIGENELHVDTVATFLMGLDPEAIPILQVLAERGFGTNRIDEIEIIDVETRAPIDEISKYRSVNIFMPAAKKQNGHYNRFRSDGTIVPWNIDRVNEQRKKDGLPSIPIT